MVEFTLKDGGKIHITEEQINNWQRIYKSINVKFQVETLAKQMENDKTLRKTSIGLNRFINRSLCKLNASKCELIKKN